MSNDPRLGEFNTVSLTPELMKQTIGFGEPIFKGIEFKCFDTEANPAKLYLGVWLALVPEIMRSAVEPIAEKVGKGLIDMEADDEAIDWFITALLVELRAFKAESPEFEAIINGDRTN